MRRAHFVMPWIVVATLAAFPAAPLAAEVIVFDNSNGDFLWLGFELQNHLDITLPPTQSGEPTSNSLVVSISEPGGGSTSIHHDGIYSSSGSTTRVAQVAVPLTFLHPFGISGGVDCHPPLPFAPGQLIAGDASWMNFAHYAVGAVSAGYVTFLGETITIGVRVVIKDRFHYGWIHFSSISWQPFAWAYETEPDVPIAAGGEVDADGVLHVPGEYPSIRAAMNNAVSGQTILVADGIYTGVNANGLDFHGKAITLRSVGGPQACVLEAEPRWPIWRTRGFHFHSGESAASVIDGFTIRNCVSDGGGGGGAMLLKNSSPTVRDCIFEGNTGFDDVGGAVAVINSSASFANCLFVGNRSVGGAAVYGGSSSATFAHCTFVGNQLDVGTPGAPHGTVSGVVGSLVNCVVYGNERGESLFALPQGGPAATYSLIEGGWPGIGNIDTDPVFVDPDGPDNDPATLADNDYRLASGSPCIDAASNPAVPRDVTEDLDGNSRFVDDPATTDTGLGRAPIVDMGAYEFQTPLDPADLDGDGVVNGFDLALLLGQWTGAASYSPCPPHAEADLNADCTINGFDLALLLGAWTGG